MATESVSFRITRNAEDLAQTIHALSHRLVTLEQRLEAMQLQLNHRLDEDSKPDARALSSLDNVERLLNDCHGLLEMDGLSQQLPNTLPPEDSTQTLSCTDSVEDFQTSPGQPSRFETQPVTPDPEDLQVGGMGESVGHAA